jgi:autotransporter-associated beta strand protein
MRTTSVTGRRSAHRLILAATAAAAGVCLYGSTARAGQSVYWDPTNGTAPGTGATNPGGTWGTGTASWGDSAGTATPAVWNNANGDTAVFSAGNDATATFTVTTNTNISLVGMTMEEGGTVTVSPATTTFTFMGGSSSLNIEVQTGTLIVNGKFNGSVVNKTGAGILNCGTTQPATFGGKWVCTGGTLAFGADVRIGQVPPATVPDVITVGSGGKFRTGGSGATIAIDANRGMTIIAGGGGFNTDTSNTTVWQGPITGSVGGDLQMGGLGSVVLSNAANNYDGNTVITAGSLRYGANNVIPSGAGKGNVTVTAGTLDLNGKSGTINGLSGAAAGTIDNVAGGGASVLTVGGNDQGGTFAGTVKNTSGTLAITKSGTGTITLGGTNSYTAGTNVNAGRLVMNRLHENNAVNITGGTLQVADSTPTLPNFPSGQNATVSRPGSMITIANDGAPLGTRAYQGTLDLGNNDLIIDYTASSPFADVSDMVRSGFNFGDWLGKGITSSTAANPLSNGNYALGVAENGMLTNPFGSQDPNDPNSLNPQFDNQTVDNTTVLVKFTHRVDLDLDGLVTGNDAAVFNGSFSEGDGGATWQTGDVDYDGVYSSNDAAIFNSFYDESLAHLPEPGALSLLGLAALGVARRRRRE